MRRTSFLIFLASFLPGAALAQPAFEVASIKPSNQTAGEVNAGFHIDGSQVRVGAMSFKDYIGMAYRLRAYQIQGPDWMAEQRFDLAATLPTGSTTAQFPEMMQALLAERFNLKLHHDKKEFPVYVLEVGKTILLEKQKVIELADRYKIVLVGYDASMHAATPESKSE